MEIKSFEFEKEISLIGDIIEAQRLARKMTRKELAEGICSEKYIYLIERNERNPSAFILNDLSDRLGIDLFEYYPYLDYDNNNQIYEHRQNIERYSQTSNIIAMKAEVDQAAKLKAFQEEPLIYDIKVVRSIYQIIMDGKSKEAITEWNKILGDDEIIIDPITLVNAYVALTTAYQLEGQWEQALESITIAYGLIEHQTKFSRYNTIVVTVLISLASLLYNMKDYKNLVKYSKLLGDFQEKYSEFNRVYYVDFYLSFAYFHIGKCKKAREHFMQGGYAALLFKNKLDIWVITQLEDFDDVAKKLEIAPEFIDQLYKVLEEE